MQPEIIYKAIRHGYAKITKEGTLKLCVPSHLRNNESFHQRLLEKGLKLFNRYTAKQQIQTISEDFILLFGEQVPIQELPNSQKKRQLELKKMLYEYAIPLLEDYSRQLEIPYKILKIKKTKSKWGSCTGNQIISLNLDLIHLPTRLIKYVIIHESCHLKIKNHSPHFRKLVEIYCPNYKLLRKELRSFILN